MFVLSFYFFVCFRRDVWQKDTKTPPRYSGRECGAPLLSSTVSDGWNEREIEQEIIEDVKKGYGWARSPH